MLTLFTSPPSTAIELAEALRLDNTLYGDGKRRATLGQYATPLKVARLMASLFNFSESNGVRLLDPGMGAGVLTLASLEAYVSEGNVAEKFDVTGYEIESSAFCATKENIKSAIAEVGPITYNIKCEDFLEAKEPIKPFTHVILNPPYKKFSSADKRQTALRNLGIHAVNLYVAFVWKALVELEPGGQLVAIIPRSFANGTYYRPFRKYVRENAEVLQVLLVDDRKSVFALDDVLQENVILVLQKKIGSFNGNYHSKITWLSGRDLTHDSQRLISTSHLWWDSEGACVLRLPREPDLNGLPNSVLSDLGLSVSTGPVVDFRVSDFLLKASESLAYPLLRPRHFANGYCIWPNHIGKRAGGIIRTSETEKFFWPSGYYVVVRRISSKEEPRRVVASLVAPEDFEYDAICFENHLNVFHRNRAGMSKELAIALCNYLNSELTDRFLRSISGHTQVNAGDLRLLPYPSLQDLLAWKID